MLVSGMEYVAMAVNIYAGKYLKSNDNVVWIFLVNTWWHLDSIWTMKWCWPVVFSGYWRFMVSCSFQITQSFRGRLLSFFRPKAAIDAHFEQTSALFRWGGRNIEIFFSPKFGELCWPDMETFGPFGGKFLGGERFIDQMKQIWGIWGILHQLKSVAFKKLNP